MESCALSLHQLSGHMLHVAARALVTFPTFPALNPQVHLLSLPRLQLLPGGSLQIDPIQVQDVGHYLCMASSPAGSDRRGLDLHVLGKRESRMDPSWLSRLQPTTAGLLSSVQ